MADLAERNKLTNALLSNSIARSEDVTSDDSYKQPSITTNPGFLTTLSVNVSYILICLEFIFDAVVGKRKPDQIVPREAVHSSVTHSISFGPAGFNMAYTGGPLRIIQEHPDKFANAAYLGTSTGSVVACCVCVGMSHETLASIMEQFNQGFAALGPRAWHKLIGMLGELLEHELPADAHTRCNGRLVIGVTRVQSGCPSGCNKLCAVFVAAIAAAVALARYLPSNVGIDSQISLSLALGLALACFFILWVGTIKRYQSFKSSFESKSELISTILGSCSIPLVQDRLPLRRDSHDTWMIDGAFTMNHAVLATQTNQHSKTITVEWDVNRVPPPDVLPSVAIPPRIVTPPSTEVMYELLDMGARDFLSHLTEKTSILRPRPDHNSALS